MTNSKPKRNGIPDPMSPTSNYWVLVVGAYVTGVIAQTKDDPTFLMVLAVCMVIHANGARIIATIKETQGGAK